VHKLLARQLGKAAKASGEVDLPTLLELVSAAYEQSDNDRRRTDRSISLMIGELDQLNRGLERLVEERTAALREGKAELRAQNLRFDAALSNMSQALLMFDSAARLVICNQRYIEMYGLSPELVRPGRTVRELLDARAKSGTFSDDPDRYIERLQTAIAQGKRLSFLSELPDGRTIAISIQPTADSGWVATHEDITERRQAEQQIAYMARHDSLTDLPNRMQFREQLARALAGVSRGERLAVLCLDLDSFKSVNDTLGHLVGDELLKAVANRLRACVRESDTAARVGGDEFAVVQTGIDTATDTATLARRICESLRAPYDLLGQTVVVDASIGIAIAPDDGTEPTELLKNADMALYGAKAHGRGTYRFFEPGMDARMKARRTLELALRAALANGEFELYYQPLVDLQTDAVTTCEALLRWQHPERGMVGPAEFIPVAEEIGLIVPLGEWVLKRACGDAALWRDDVKVAVNLSPIQVMSKNLVAVVVGALASSGLPAHRLEIEITESVLLQNTELTLATLHRLRELGVKISMDDFGTGYSSLSYLRSFPFDKIKIDRCFISGLGDGDDARAIVQAIAGLARNLGIMTTAEGVETEQQLEQVRFLGCTEMQGYLFSPPRRVEDIRRLLRPRVVKRALIA
jgi:diguanylate cyclase (GGDEF)-like protein/PAS domain S-box-containing protein